MKWFLNNVRSPNKNTLATGGNDNKIMIWDIRKMAA
jgi:WD40 repeat protein